MEENKAQEINVGSIISLILGIVGLFIFGIIAGIGAIAFGYGKDDNIAKVGMVLGVVDIGIMVVFYLIAF